MEIFFVVGSDVKPYVFGMYVADGGAESDAVARWVVCYESSVGGDC